MIEKQTQTARAATLKQLRENVLPNFLDPVPSDETLRNWFESANIPRLKANPTATRGGGPCYYSVSAIERFLRSRFMPCKLSTATA